MPQTIAKVLKSSPMYNLSLSSKELFHSNFLAWLGNNSSTKPFFRAIIKSLTGIDLNQHPNWVVEREDKNVDLCIKEGNNYILVIENKVKSIPRKDQLDDYYNKLSGKKVPKFMLLTLVTDFPDKNNILKAGLWDIKFYTDLAQEMQNKISLVNGQYELLIIKDYISFIDNFSKLEAIWRKQIGQFGFAVKAPAISGINRIIDLYTKIQFSNYCILISQELQNALKFYNIELYNSNILKKKRKNPVITVDPQKIYIDVQWGYSSRGHEGVLDVAIPITDLANPQIPRGTVHPNSYIKFQIEDTNYRHVLEMPKNVAVQNLINIGKNTSLYTGNQSKIDFFSSDPLNKKLPLPKYGTNIFLNQLKPVDYKRIGNNWPFASFGNGFIYQSMDIKPNTPVNAVLGNIVGEVARIFKIIPIV